MDTVVREITYTGTQDHILRTLRSGYLPAEGSDQFGRLKVQSKIISRTFGGEIEYVGPKDIEYWVLHISNDNGDSSSLHRTRFGAEEELLRYVSMYWKQEIGDAPMPLSTSEAIEMYFEFVEGELADIQPCKLED